MTRISRHVFAIATASVLFAAPAAFAETSLILPPYDGSAPAPKVDTQSQALAALQARGVADVNRLGKVGDYWESDGIVGGQPVVAYVFDNGAVEVKSSTPAALQSAALPRVGLPEQTAELP